MSASETSYSAKGVLRAVLALAALAAPLFAASYVIPPDADLIHDADVIAIVTIRSSHSYYTADGTIATDHARRLQRLTSEAPSGILINPPAGTITSVCRSSSLARAVLLADSG